LHIELRNSAKPKTRMRHQKQRDTRKKTRGKKKMETRSKRRGCAGIMRLDWTKRREKDNERSHPEIQTEHKTKKKDSTAQERKVGVAHMTACCCGLMR
jgi:hypothetical protein